MSGKARSRGWDWAIYAVGHTVLSVKGRMMAAVLAGGVDAVLSYYSAARLRDLPAPGGPIHVTVPRKLASRPGLTFHHHRLPGDEVEEIDGIPVTTCARTIFDLAAVLPAFRLEKVVQEAEYRRLSDAVSVPMLLERYPGARGNKALRAVLELDDLGRDAHERAAAFESDRRRDRKLLAAGWRPMRVTWHQLDTTPNEVESDLRTLLARRT